MTRRNEADVILDVMQTGQGAGYSPNYNQKAIVKERLGIQLKKHKRVLLVYQDIYRPQPAAVVTITKLYDNFALGYVYNKLSDTKIPYTINYTSIIAKDYRVESAYEE